MGVSAAQPPPLLPHAAASSSSQIFFLSPSIPSPPSSRTRARGGLNYRTIRSVPAGLWRSPSLEIDRRARRRAASASFDASFPGDDDEEFLRRLHELAADFVPEPASGTDDSTTAAGGKRFSFSPPEPEWEGEMVVAASVERKANSVELPLSLRIIKRRKRWEEGVVGAAAATETARCAVSKAFASMVFIIRELHSFTLQTREALRLRDVGGVLARVHQEMHASFVWLFQHIFSSTPTLMLSLMLLLANFTVQSMGHNPALAAAAPLHVHSPSIVATAAEEDHHQQSRFDPASIKTSVGRTASVGGGSGGGGKVRPVAGATDDGRSDSSSSRSTILPDGMSGIPASVGEEEEVVKEEEAAALWDRVVEEAARLQASMRNEALMDPETLRWLVSPVKVEIEPESDSEYLQTELMYHQAVSQDPSNPLILSNFAQFLYLVLHDHDRAEHYFKRAASITPADAECLSRYASFLWLARQDLSAAEETYLEAIAADPNNTYHAATYAHFLWSTGGEDTCYPLDGPDCT